MSITNSIKNWAEDERPREKLLHKGANTLADAELLAILIGSGTTKSSALDLARDILNRAHNNLSQLGRLSLKELQQTKGIGEARAITIAAALELGRRRQKTEGLQRQQINTTPAAAEVLVPILADLNHEVMCVLYLNQANRMLSYELVSSGGITATIVDIRLILKSALMQNATKLIMAHNHPSGSLRASEPDMMLTRRMKEAAALMEIRLVDHMIVAGTQYFSFKDEHLL